MNRMAANASSFRISTLARRALLAVCASVASAALADTTTLSIASSSATASNSPVPLAFPLTRTGDTGYDARLTFHTVDGTAVAGVDYTSLIGSLVSPANSIAANILVTLAANESAGPDLTFQLAIDSATGIGPVPSFAAQQSFASGQDSESVVVGDLNGDGKPDVIVSNYYDGNVVILLNTTAPGSDVATFAAAQTFSVGGGVAQVAIGDLNGDGRPDLVLARSYDEMGNGAVSTLVNSTVAGSSLVTFGPLEELSTSGHTLAVAVGDLNGDGVADVVASGNGFTSVFLNSTTPGASSANFLAPQSAFNAGGVSIAIGDLNGDGRPDLAVIVGNQLVAVDINGTAPGALTVQFATRQDFTTGDGNTAYAPLSVLIRDTNGDGEPDIIVANSVGRGSIGILLNTTLPGAASASFAEVQNFLGILTADAVAAVDLNGDGKLDFIASSITNATISVLRGTTDAGSMALSFDEPETFATSTGCLSVASADFNGDGKADLVATNFGDHTSSVFINDTPNSNASSNFSTPDAFTVGTSPRGGTAVDLNGDGKADLVVASGPGFAGPEGSAWVLMNTTEAGSFSSTFAAPQPFSTGAAPDAVTHADLNNDGKQDLVVVNQGDNTLSILLGETQPGATTATFAPQQVFSTGILPSSVTAVDVNGDGRPDIAVTNVSSGTLSIFVNDTEPGADTVSLPDAQEFATGTYPVSVATGDFNGDGRPDFVVANNGDGTVSILLNVTDPGSTTVALDSQQVFAAGGSPGSVAVVDVNGDGRPDLAIANNLDAGSVTILVNTTLAGSSTITFADAQTFAVGTALNSLLVSDVDGDGKPDVVVANLLGTTVVSVLLNQTPTGSSIANFSAPQNYEAGASPGFVFFADLNGDGKPDLIATDYGSNTVSVLLNTQYEVLVAGSPATGTIVHDVIFENGFE